VRVETRSLSLRHAYGAIGPPRITVEVGTATFPVEATEVTGVERDELWRRLVEMRPGFAEYETKTSRIFPMFRLTRLS